MILEVNINNNLNIQTLEDLAKLKPLEENGYKVNYSRLSRELKKDRRTIKKYVNGYQKPKRRKRKSKLDKYYEIIKNLLTDEYKTFEYISVLWRVICDTYDDAIPESTFRYYINSVEEFKNYFKDKTKRKVKKSSLMRYETDKGKQAQLDWKESVSITLNTGEVVCINIFTLLLSYSRFRVYRLSIDKTQDILINFIDEAFEVFGGVPDEILCDNMKTIMDISRTEYSPGKVNNKFQQFADDYGFKVKPCIAGRPSTKGKVEAPMKILDELKAYGNELDFNGLVKLLERINNRENNSYHKSYDSIPILGLSQEKNSLHPLPKGNIRNQYKIKAVKVKVNQSSMITYANNQYSVPPKYINSTLTLQHYDNRIHLYSNTELVVIHDLSSARLNYKNEHYIEIMKRTLPHSDTEIEQIAKENLEAIGKRYKT